VKIFGLIETELQKFRYPNIQQPSLNVLWHQKVNAGAFNYFFCDYDWSKACQFGQILRVDFFSPAGIASTDEKPPIVWLAFKRDSVFKDKSYRIQFADPPSRFFL
jgi:hypothetical protein